MSAMNALLGKPASQYNGIEYCIVKTWTNPKDVDERMAEKAAAEYLEKNIELNTLRERVAKLESQLKDAQKVAVYFSKLGHGVRPSLGAMRLVRAYEATLKSQ